MFSKAPLLILKTNTAATSEKYSRGLSTCLRVGISVLWIEFQKKPLKLSAESAILLLLPAHGNVK